MLETTELIVEVSIARFNWENDKQSQKNLDQLVVACTLWHVLGRIIYKHKMSIS